jgi:multidrug efflux pump subunit AcrA (membrane-fusion protein)
MLLGSVQAETDDLKQSRQSMDNRLEDLRAQLEASLRAHEATLHQLETAKFFLQVGAQLSG